MLRYTIKRVLGMIPTLIIVVTFVFFFVRLIPGDPARLVAGEQATLQDVEAVRERLGLNQPVYIQYIKYILGLLQGDLGTSPPYQSPGSYRSGFQILEYHGTYHCQPDLEYHCRRDPWRLVRKKPGEMAGFYRNDSGGIGNLPSKLLDRFPSDHAVFG